MSEHDGSKQISDNEEYFNEESQNIADDNDFGDNNILNIMIATDIHLGYEQTTKRVQEDDSFRTFEEILQCAKHNEVDMILLGGDLFHEAKPPHNVIMRCINLLRTYCLSDKSIKMQLLTNPELAFSHCEHKVVNYEDPNLNVGIPVFSIHGNHDDPSYGAVGSMDVLSATGLINYFGKWTDVTQVKIAPLYFRKGVTTVALYGLSYMNDQRLSRLMRNNKFHMLQAEDIPDAFNIFILHQNRAQHSQNSYVPESLIPDFLHLVVWGHEHECIIIPEQSKMNAKIHICQPGSSVATSLAQGEAIPKHVGILSVFKNKFKMKSIKLKTVRPFVFEDVVLNEHSDEITKFISRPEAVENFIDHFIENVLIPQAAEQQTGHPMQPEKPLIRLRIHYNEDRDVFDTLRLSQKYYHVAANPNDMLLFRKCSLKLKKKDIRIENHDFEELGEIFRFDDENKDWKRTVKGGMTEYFSQEDKMNKLTVLSLHGLNEALSKFVDANDTKAFHDLVKHQMKKTVSFLMKSNYKDKSEILAAIHNYRNLRLQEQKQEIEEVESFLNSRTPAVSKITRDADNSLLQEKHNFNHGPIFNDNQIEHNPPKSRGRGRGRGRGGSIDGRSISKSVKSKGSPLKYFKGSNYDIIATVENNHSILSWKKSVQTTPKQSSKMQILLDSDSD